MHEYINPLCSKLLLKIFLQLKAVIEKKPRHSILRVWFLFGVKCRRLLLYPRHNIHIAKRKSQAAESKKKKKIINNSLAEIRATVSMVCLWVNSRVATWKSVVTLNF